MRTIKQDIIPGPNLVQRRRLHDAVVRRALVVEDGLGTAEEGGGVAGHALDLDGGGSVGARGGAALAGGAAAQGVAVYFPEDPAVCPVVVAGGVDDAAAGCVADQGGGLGREGAEGRGGGGEADAVGAAGLVGGVVHYVDAGILGWVVFSRLGYLGMGSRSSEVTYVLLDVGRPDTTVIGVYPGPWVRQGILAGESPT